MEDNSASADRYLNNYWIPGKLGLLRAETHPTVSCGTPDSNNNWADGQVSNSPNYPPKTIEVRIWPSPGVISDGFGFCSEGFSFVVMGGFRGGRSGVSSSVV